jgi:16S rRNA (adenine1518-N6/adenine1519-N6)-dimethyltransferase
MVLMVQREVADRICASPRRGKAYGILTVKLALWWRVTSRFEVARDEFFPQPQVEAAVLALEPLEPSQTPSAASWPALGEFIDAAFGQRRKMLVNSLAGVWKRFPGKMATCESMEALGLSAKARAEDLSPDQLRRLHARLESC